VGAWRTSKGEGVDDEEGAGLQVDADGRGRIDLVADAPARARGQRLGVERVAQAGGRDPGGGTVERQQGDDGAGRSVDGRGARAVDDEYVGRPPPELDLAVGQGGRGEGQQHAQLVVETAVVGAGATD